MRVLITNDDSINAPGLVSAEKIARQLSDDIWIVAPETDQSGIGHALSISAPLRAREVEPQKFAISGTPADCVIMAVRQIMPELPDLIISGVNSGQNIADDVLYSGTVAGAVEGALLGIRSIALSQAYKFGDRHIIPWETCEAHAAKLIEKTLKVDLPKRRIVNINFPNCAPDAVAGTKVTAQGSLNHGLYIQERLDGRQLPYHWITFDRTNAPVDDGFELHALRNNQISVTVLQCDWTDKETNKAMAEALK